MRRYQYFLYSHLFVCVSAAALPMFGLLACGTGGGGGPEATKTPEGGTVKPADTAAEKATPEPGTGEKRAAGSPNADKDEKAGTSPAFAGDDPGKVVAITTKRAFSVGPGDNWFIGLHEFVRTEGTKNIFKEPGMNTTFAVPGAYTMPALPQVGLKKGAAILIPDEGQTSCARVISATDKEIKAAMMTGDTEAGQKTLPPDEVLVLDGKLGFGARVAYQSDSKEAKWQVGGLVYTDGTTAWLEGAMRVPVAQVRAMDVNKLFKAGDKVWALPPETAALVPATIAQVKSDGLFYQIKLADGSLKYADFCSVTSPIP